MKKYISLTTIAAASVALSGCMTTDNDQMASDAEMELVQVGGADMYPTRNIIENAVNSPIHTTLVAAVKQAGLVETLSGPGPFTVFAPTNEAFDRLAPGTVEMAMKPENKALLQTVLTYHVVPGRVTANDLMAKIRAGGGKAMVKTVAGENLTFTMVNGNVKITGKTGTAFVTQADVMQSNGVIHVVNGVLLPQ